MRIMKRFGLLVALVALTTPAVHGLSADVQASDADRSRVPWIDCLSSHLLASRSGGEATSFAAARDRARAACRGHLAAWRRFLAEQDVRVPAAAVDDFVDRVLLRVWQVQL